jgi:membrane protease YdiL (CAAX protease family)
MKSLSKSTKLYVFLILLLACLTAASFYLPLTEQLGDVELPASKPVMALVSFLSVLVIYGGLGFLGLKLSKKLGYPDLLDKKISNKQRFLIPAIAGAVIGVVFIIIDLIYSANFSFGALPHPEFPFSIIASLTAGIGEEIVFRLFFISFWVWLIGKVILKGKLKNYVFWIIALISGILFALAHLPSVFVLYGYSGISEIPLPLLSELMILNIAVSLPAAYYFRKYGILAAMGIHFWTDIIWHVIYGLF